MTWKIRHQRPVVAARTKPAQLPERLQGYLANGEASVAEPFKGITVDGQPIRALFSLKPTGVATDSIRRAAEGFVASLTGEQKERALFPVDTSAWRRWSNIHPWIMRHGVPLEEMSASQRESAVALLAACLSQTGVKTARDVMRLNHFIGEVTQRWDEYGEWLYWMSVMGAPSATEPWGWQIDGHHLIVNCLVIGDQLVMTPMFMGSEPVHADSGQFAGTRVFATEEAKGLAFMRALDPGQRAQATIGHELPVELFTAAFRDNFEMKYDGLRSGDLSPAQRDGLLDLLEVYVGRVRPGHAAVRMDEVRRHLDDTWFAWMGSTDDAGVFYYRIHSPVILVEFDHQRGIALDNDEPSRDHIHTVVRTPNGNDYGKDLLRQHHERFAHARSAR